MSNFMSDLVTELKRDAQTMAHLALFSVLPAAILWIASDALARIGSVCQ